MWFEPQKFFIGLIDFFAILLPGAVLTFLAADRVGPTLLGDRYDELSGVALAAAFLIASYLTGHFVFLVASLVLDDLVVERVRRATPTGQVRHLARGGELASPPARFLARVGGAASADGPLRVVEDIKDAHVRRITPSPGGTINTYQWCKARLTLEHPEASVVVQRFEADSKFFRSLVVVMVVVGGAAAVAGEVVLALISGALGAAALIRYADQRVEATRQAYWFMFTIESEQLGADAPPRSASTEEPRHAAALVFDPAWRPRGPHGPDGPDGPDGSDGPDGRQRLLLVRSVEPARRALPSGVVAHAERPAEAAVRQVFEQTGCWARVVRDAGVQTLPTTDGHVPARMFVMQLLRDARDDELQVSYRWVAHAVVGSHTDDATKTVIDAVGGGPAC